MARRHELPALILALLTLAGCKQSSATRRTEQFIPVKPGTAVSVKLDTGYITVAEGRKGMVSLKVFRKVRAVWGASSKLKDIEVKATKEAQVLRIRGKAPSSTSSRKYHMHVQLTVPPRTAVTLETQNGHINVKSLQGDVQARTARGEVRARGVTGAQTLRTKEGNVVLRGAPRRFQVHTKLGNVTLWLRPETQLDGACTARTESGGLTLHATPTLHALVTAEAKGGTVQSAFPTESKKGGWLRARLGRGAPAIDLRCHKGTLALRKWNKKASAAPATAP